MNVFLTGASSGLGAALARHYAAAGASLGLFSRRGSELERVAASLGAAEVAVYAGDVRNASDLLRAAQLFLERFGAPDIVIANAGVSVGTLTEHREDNDAFRAVLETNVLGLVHTFQPFIAAMRERRQGRLAGVASIAGLRGLPGSGAYCASKAAAITYLESLRVELCETGIRVVTVCPGYIDTPMTARNPYRMPFRLAPDVAARRVARSIAQGRRLAVVPWQMACVGALLRLLPGFAFDRAFAHAPRKPRRSEA